MDYELGSNSTEQLCKLENEKPKPMETLKLLQDCIGAQEILLFHWLLDRVDVRPPEKNELSQLLLPCCTSGQFAHIKALLEFGVNPNYCSADAETPISSAAAWGNDSCILLLLRHGARLQTLNPTKNEELELIKQNCGYDTVQEVYGYHEMNLN